MKYALVNTMNNVGREIGSAISFHASEEAAEKANAKFQKSVKRANGQSSYMPTKIVAVKSAKPLRKLSGGARADAIIYPEDLA